MNIRKSLLFVLLFFAYNMATAQSGAMVSNKDTTQAIQIDLGIELEADSILKDSIPEIVINGKNTTFTSIFADSYLTQNEETKDIYQRPYSLWANYPNYRGIARNTGIMFGASIIGVGLLWIMPESFTNWDKQQMKEDGIFSKWVDNITTTPIMDKDDWFLNYIMHPYFGAAYYMSARSLGFNAAYSFAYSAFLSTCFWEYGIESFAEKPSLQDLIITPVGGALLGEVFYLAKRGIVANRYRLLGSPILGHTATFLMDPITEIVDLCSGKFKKQKNISLLSYPSVTPSGRFSYNVSFVLNF